MNEVAIYSISEIEKAATYIAKSGLFGVKTPEQAVALMLVAQAEGRNPFEAARDYHIIQNRPALKADAILARFQQAGGSVEWLEYTDKKVVGKFSHPQGGSVTIDWTIERAQQAGLAGRDNWKNYPRAMLRARCISEGVRTVYPGVSSGIYTVEEVQDMSEAKPAEGAEMEVIDESKPEEAPEEEGKRIVREKNISLERRNELWEMADKKIDAYVSLLREEPAVVETNPFKRKPDTKRADYPAVQPDGENSNELGIF